jgi:hypothetical protein
MQNPLRSNVLLLPIITITTPIIIIITNVVVSLADIMPHRMKRWKGWYPKWSRN